MGHSVQERLYLSWSARTSALRWCSDSPGQSLRDDTLAVAVPADPLHGLRAQRRRRASPERDFYFSVRAWHLGGRAGFADFGYSFYFGLLLRHVFELVLFRLGVFPQKNPKQIFIFLKLDFFTRARLRFCRPYWGAASAHPYLLI